MNNYHDNYNYTRPPRKGVIVIASLAFAVIFGLAAYSTYVQQTDLAHSVHVSPTSAHYGTLSTARPQALAVPMQRSSAPMISGGAVRSYAYSGHSSTPTGSTGSGFKIHTTSSATVHTIGSGGGGGGASGGSVSSSRRMSQQTTVASVSFPSLAMVTPVMTTTTTTTETSPSKYGIAPRRAPSYSGSYEGEQGEDGGKYWIWDGESWIEAGAIPVGTTKLEGGITYRWNGTEWEIVGDQQEPGVPVGNAPWLILVLLSMIYVLTKRKYV